VLELVHGREEQRGEQRGRYADKRAERNEAKGTPPRNGLVRLGRAHARTVSSSPNPQLGLWPRSASFSNR
jgi:hypothetical protein